MVFLLRKVFNGMICAKSIDNALNRRFVRYCDIGQNVFAQQNTNKPKKSSIVHAACSVEKGITNTLSTTVAHTK